MAGQYTPNEGSWSLASLFSHRPRPRTADIELMPEPQLPPSPQNLRPPMPPPAMPPMFGGDDEDVTMGSPYNEFGGDEDSGGGFSDMRGGSPEQTSRALAGLQASQSDQFSPFSDMEVSRMASNRGFTAPGSNEYWGNELKERQGRHAGFEAQDMAKQGVIGGAIASGHPAVVGAQQRTAMAQSLPAQITARGQLQAAKEAAAGRVRAGDAAAQARIYGSQMNHSDTIMQAIKALGGDADANPMLMQALKNLYDLYNEDLTGATFDEAQDYEAQ